MTLQNLRPRLVTAAFAALTFWLAFDGGTYSLGDRGTLAIALLWATIVLLALAIWPVTSVPRPAIVTAGLLGAFGGWTLLSSLWGPSAEDVVTEFNRVSLYVGALLVTVFVTRRGSAPRVTDGLAIGLVGIAVIALLSRLFPSLFELRGLPEFLPASRNRLSFPVDYWNGLGILTALSIPLLLRAAVDARHLAWRAGAIAPFPVLAAVLFLTSSRGGFIVAVTGAMCFVVFAGRRWAAAGAASAAAAGAAATVWMLLVRKALANEAPGTTDAVAEGHSAAVWIVVLTGLTALLGALVSRYGPRDGEVRPAIGRAVGAAAAVLALAAFVALHPIRFIETFKTPPSETRIAQADFARAHLLSGGSSGRWQFWEAAFDEFLEHPVVGGGAGSYEAWWTQHGTISYFARDAHSLFLETLGELGIVGFALLAAAFGWGLVVGLRRTFAGTAARRTAAAAPLAAFIAFLVAAGVDWVWELTVVTLVGVVCLGLLVGTATEEPEAEPVGARAKRERRFGLGAFTILFAWVLLCVQAVPLLADSQIRASQRAAQRGGLDDAADHARAARKLEPWAASPYLQLALVAESAGEFGTARARIEQAIERDESDWRLWLVAARVQTKDGDVADARESLDVARRLNPRSPLFAEP